MTPDELLNPRYKVIADYPNSRFKIGDILFKYRYPSSPSMYTYVTNPEIPLKGTSLSPEYVEKMNHLFKPLQWWEERKAEDMPAYVKCLKSPDQIIEPGSVLKVAWNDHGGKVEKGPWIFPYTNCYEPATEEDYTTYINSK